MFYEKEDRKDTVMSNLRGGIGDVVMRPVVTEGTLPPHYRLLNDCVMEKGCSIGMHPHEGESEVYYILEGEATVTDAAGTRKLQPGDAEICFDGESHTVINEGDEPLKMLCVIVTNA